MYHHYAFDWSTAVTLFSAMAGNLAGIVVVCLTLFLSKGRDENTGNVLRLLTSLLWSFVAAAYFYGESTAFAVKPPVDTTHSKTLTGGMELFNELALLAGFIFSSAITQMFLCVSFLIHSYNPDPDVRRAANGLVLLAVIAIAIVMIDVAARAVDTRLSLYHGYNPVHHLIGFACAISVPIWAYSRMKRTMQNHSDEAIRLSKASLGLAMSVAAVSVILPGAQRIIPSSLFLVLDYGFMTFLGIVFAQCLVCRPDEFAFHAAEEKHPEMHVSVLVNDTSGQDDECAIAIDVALGEN